MPPLDPHLQALVTALGRGLRAIDARFCLIGALVPELLLDVRPRRRTNDADAVVLVGDLDAFEKVKRDLNARGFSPSRVPYRLEYAAGGWVDLLPYGDRLAPSGTLQLSPDVSITTAGFDRLAAAAIDVPLPDGTTVPVAPLPLYVLLKLVAYTDRGLPKDPASVLHVLQHYAADDDRRFGLEHEGELVPFEFTSACLVGLDGRTYVDGNLRRLVSPVVSELTVPDSPLVDRVLRENGLVSLDEEPRREAAERFRWFQRGAGL